MKNIYFVEVGFSFDGSVYLPYATGTIAAYLKHVPGFSEEYSLAGFIYKREDTACALEKLKEPYLVGFSCSIWNFEFNKLLAKKLKEKYPSCIIVFGGHNVSENSNLLKTEDYIDILSFGEGEKTFASLISSPSDTSLVNTDNISFRKNGVIITTPRSYSDSLDGFPSPYLSGIFDDIMKNDPDTDFLSVLETNRGCPHSCAYCDWCAGKKVRMFPIEKVMQEIKWLSDHKIGYCFCADSNFGMFERDIQIANTLADYKKTTGYPQIFRPCYEKNSDTRVFAISSILNRYGMDKGATMAYQTLSDEALRNINRKNLTLKHFSSLLAKYTAAGIPTYSELILGLPGETKESFCQGICKLLESGQHNSLSVYHCEMLPNSIMSTEPFINKYDIKSIKVSFNHMHSKKKQEEAEEYSHIVQSTSTLSFEDWIYCNLFSICVQCFHSLGFLRFIAIYLYYENDVSYFDFYSSLLEYILSDSSSLLCSLFGSFRDKLTDSLSGDWNYINPDFGEVSWTFEEGAYLMLLKNSDTAWTELKPFITKYFRDKDILNEIIKYQKSILKTCGVKESKIVSKYDFVSYFLAVFSGCHTPVITQSTEITFTAEKSYSSWEDFAREIVWYGRRRGDTVYWNKAGKTPQITEKIL